MKLFIFTVALILCPAVQSQLPQIAGQADGSPFAQQGNKI